MLFVLDCIANDHSEICFLQFVLPNSFGNCRSTSLSRSDNSPLHKRDSYFLHAQIQEFSSGGGSMSVRQKSPDNVSFLCSPQLILQKSNGQFQRNLSFSRVPEGVQHFPGGGVQLFPGGGGWSNCLFPIETHITCDFPGGGRSGPPVLPSGSTLVVYLL